MEILLFLQENWKIAVVLAIDLAILLVSIFKKRVKVIDNVKEFILSILPLGIFTAESLFSDGVQKKDYVLQWVSSRLANEFHIKDISEYIDFISDSIEKILSTPQKKGE